MQYRFLRYPLSRRMRLEQFQHDVDFLTLSVAERVHASPQIDA